MSDASRVHTLALTSDPEELARMRSWLRRVLASGGASEQEEAAILTAVGELCTNAIRHAYGGGGQPIHLKVAAFEDRLVVEVEDFGRPFDPARYVPPDLDAGPEHGVGLFLARSLVDSLEPDVARPRGTRWVLVKYRAGYRPPNTEGNAMS